MSAAAAILIGMLLLVTNGERRREVRVMVVDEPAAAASVNAPLLLARNAMDPPVAKTLTPHPRRGTPSTASRDIDRAVDSGAAFGLIRTWVSGVGDDVNPCSRTAPCKTFAGAISKTATGGIIEALDPGGFGAVTITKSMTIEEHETLADVLHSGVQGITNFTSASLSVGNKTPAAQLEQASNGCVPIHTFDFGADCTTFVRGVTDGSRRRFHIRPGARTGSVEVSATDTDQVLLRPAATLLLPYFDVEATAAGTTTFTIANPTDTTKIAHVTVWTDRAAPALDFNLFLTGYDTQAITLHDFERALQTADKPMLTAATYDGLGRAITIAACSTRFPASEVLFDNVLIGDYQQLGQAVDARTPLVDVVHFAAHGTIDTSSGFHFINIEPSTIDTANCSASGPTHNWVIISPTSARDVLEPEIIPARFEVRCEPPLVCTPGGRSRDPP
jgi:hypothetical protein